MSSTASGSRANQSTAHLSSSDPSSTLGSAFKGSFANLVRLVGLSRRGSADTEGEGETEDDDEDAGEGDEAGEADEESLMWDAQTALIAHHTDLAVKLYTQAALPPYCSPAACLALGNLLIRGSTLAEHDDAYDIAETHDAKGKGKADHASPTSTSPPSFFSRLFGPSTAASNSPPLPAVRPPAVRRGTTDLVASGWQIPRDGKRAVRDVKSMGVAAAWFVLGLGWLVQAQVEFEKEQSRQVLSKNVTDFLASIPNGKVQIHDEPDTEPLEEEVLTFESKSKSKSKKRAADVQSATTVTPGAIPQDESHTSDLDESTSTIDGSESTATLCPPRSGPGSSSGTTESPMVKTPGIDGPYDPFTGRFEPKQTEVEALQMMYDLLVPLLHLYRHGHIQPHDPVALPPISLQALPASLRPRNESDKRRNVWHLGGLLSSRLVKLNVLQSGQHQSQQDTERFRGGVNIVANYILAMTAHDIEAEMYFRNVISNPLTGLDLADDLIRQAAKRLDILSSTPKDESNREAFPFPSGNRDHYLSPPKRSTVPKASPQKRKASLPTHSPGHHRQPSANSISSISSTSFSRIICSPIKSSPSVASLTTISDHLAEPVTVQLGGHIEGIGGALSSLKRIHASSMSDLTAALEVEGEEDAAEEPRYPTLNGWKMSPPPRKLSMPSESLAAFSTSHVSQRTIVPSSTAGTERVSIASPRNTLGTNSIDGLRPVASSPQFGTLRDQSADIGAHGRSTSSSTPRRRLPFEPTGEIATIDPALAAAEMSSALTKHATCGVCGTQGVNFPECRKCGLTFCSRGCRVAEDKAGNGKKHICGAWESRRLLCAPAGAAIQPPHLDRAVSSARATKVC